MMKFQTLIGNSKTDAYDALMFLENEVFQTLIGNSKTPVSLNIYRLHFEVSNPHR